MKISQYELNAALKWYNHGAYDMQDTKSAILPSHAIKIIQAAFDERKLDYNNATLKEVNNRLMLEMYN